jgi:hypothetical protein
MAGEELVQLGGRMIGDATQHAGEAVVRIEAVELGAFGQRADRRGTAATGIGAGKQIILAANGDTRKARSGLLSRARRPSSKQRTRAAQRARM